MPLRSNTSVLPSAVRLGCVSSPDVFTPAGAGIAAPVLTSIMPMSRPEPGTAWS